MVDQPVAEGVDFALALYREDGRWVVESMPPRVAADLRTLVTALRQRPGDAGAIGLVSVDEDFFVAVRVLGPDVRLLLSDVTAATEWPLAREVLDHLGLPLPDDDDQIQPAGEIGIFADLGAGPMDVAAICDDVDLYPEEMLAEVADRLGIAREYAQAVETALG
jgi:putative tRNA adenosine deaminase-associated protein